jgi:hypothetical protein
MVKVLCAASCDGQNISIPILNCVYHSCSFIRHGFIIGLESVFLRWWQFSFMLNFNDLLHVSIMTQL